MKTTTINQVKMIPVALCRALPQVRTTFKEDSIDELAADIAARGVLQPLVVRPDGGIYTIVIGERRFRAIQKTGAAMLPAIVADPESLRNSDLEEIQLTENIQREDLSAKDLAAAVTSLWKRYGSVGSVAKKCHKSPSWVSKRLAIGLDVGPLTAELLDSNAKDTELLYAFATLEKADKNRARALLPEILEGSADRKTVKNALAETLGKRANDDQQAPAPSNQGDLFRETEPVKADPAQLQQAIEALKQIAGIASSLSPLEKWQKAREIAQTTLKAIGQ